MKAKILDVSMHILFLLCACVSILAVLLICIFMFINGLPPIFEIGPGEFLLGTLWKPVDIPPSFGILPMIVGSLYVTAGAVLVGVPIGLLTALFMACFCPAWLHKILKPIVSLLAGIPSIVYGFFGVRVLVPWVRETFDGTGNSVFTASLLLGIMILPTIISLSEASLRAVDEMYYHGALALGATKEISVIKVVMPAAGSGIFASIVLGIGRAIGETMAVIWVAGNNTAIPDSIFDGVRTLTANIVLEMGYSTGLHTEALIATGVVLFVFILILNACFALLGRKRG